MIRSTHLVSAVLRRLLQALVLPAVVAFAPSPLGARAIGDELLANGAALNASEHEFPGGWKARGEFPHARVLPKSADAGVREGVVFEFSAKNAGATQVVALDPTWWKLELRFRMKTRDVVSGKADWQNARMALRFIDDNWKTVAPWPKNVGKTGTHDWAEHKQTLTVPEGAKSLVIEPAMFGESGTVWFSDISLRAVSGRPVKADAISPFGASVDPWAWKDAWKARSATRERVSLNGYWRFFPVYDKPVEGGATADQLPAAGSGWGFFKVPGYWGNDNRSEQPVILSPWIEKNLSEAKIARDSFSRAWYQRRIDIPDTWSGRRIVLTLEDVQGTAEVFVAGRKIGVVGWPGGDLDLTPHCAPGRSHELSIRFETRLSTDNPFAPPLYKNALAAGTPPTLRNRGLCGDTWLTALPGPARAGVELGSVLVRTSVRDGRIAFRTPFFTAKGHADDSRLDDLYLRAEIFDADGRKVKTLASRPGILRDAKPHPEAPLENERIVTWDGEWNPRDKDGPALWDLENPRLYTARVAVVRRGAGGQGELVDESLPVRFGFREFWIEGRDMILNGNRVSLRAFQVRNNMHPSSYMAGMDVCRDTITNIKELGGNFATTHNYQVDPGQTGYGGNLYTAADEMGLMLSFTLPHARSYGWELEKPEVRASFARLSRWLIDLHGNHPSIVLYAASHNSIYNLDMNPLKVDGMAEPKKDETIYMDVVYTRDLGMRRWQSFNILEPVMATIDPSRIIYHHSGGNAQAMITQNDYPVWSPPQERAEFRAEWAERGKKPLFLIEYGLPHTASYTSYRGPHFIYNKAALSQPKWWLDSEYASVFFNQESYRTSPLKAESRAAHIKRLLSGKPAGWGKLKEATNYYDVLALHMRHYLPAFRTFGVSVQLWDMEELWTRDANAPRQWHPGDRERPVTVADVSAPGIRPDFHGLAWQRVYDRPGNTFWVETSATREMRRWNHPVIAYIGGGDPDIAGFTERSHNFEPGQSVRKQLIVVNDGGRPAECRYEWSLEGTGARGGGSLSTGPGGQARQPVEITLPRDLRAGRYRLSASFTFGDGSSQSDEFMIDVLAPAPAAPSGPVVLFDPEGDSSRTLSRLGIAHTRHDTPDALPDADAMIRDQAVLVIGRRALTLGQKLPQLEAVSRGLNVLVFEQSEEALRTIGGFRTQTLRVRNAFKRVPDHPALRNLNDEHLADWHGESSLIDKFENSRDLSVDEPKTEWCGFRNNRVWHTSNRGAVATALIEKPSVGDFLPLIDCGFDLQYSPLIEWRPAARGSSGGRMILCQLDVTGRSRPDPAADRLVLNLLESARQPLPPKARTLVYAGDERGKAVLTALGFAPEPYGRPAPAAESVLVIGPGAPVIKNLDARVREGLRVLTIGLSKADLVRQWPQRFADAEETDVVPSFLEADALAVPEFAGISNAQTHWWNFPRTAALPDAADAKGNNVLQRVAVGRGVIVFSQGAPWLFADEDKPWQRTTWRHSVFLVSRLLHNMDAAARDTGGLEKLLAAGTTGRVKPWLNTHYLQTPIRSDDPYIYYRW